MRQFYYFENDKMFSSVTYVTRHNRTLYTGNIIVVFVSDCFTGLSDQNVLHLTMRLSLVFII